MKAAFDITKTKGTGKMKNSKLEGLTKEQKKDYRAWRAWVKSGKKAVTK